MKKALTLLTWPDYISPQTLLGFEAEFGVKVELKLVPSAVELIERMQASSSGIDVLVPPDYAVRELSALGLLLKLDPSQLPNLDHLDLRFFRGRAHDPESGMIHLPIHRRTCWRSWNMGCQSIQLDRRGVSNYGGK
jgi:spermidine/putrescine transport system substrate-binding protein